MKNQVSKESSCPILILPGFNGSGPEHWQTRWELRLPNAKRVVAADWDHPDKDEWVECLDRAVASTGSKAVLVAHSLGCLQIVHWAASGGRSVAGALLVAPPDPNQPDFPDVIIGFNDVPLMKLPFPSILVASTNDPYSTFSFSAGCAKAWGSRLVDVGPLGHINSNSGLGDWEVGLRLLYELGC